MKEDNENCKHYSLFYPKDISKEFISINFEGRGHYNLMHLKKIKTEARAYNKKVNDQKIKKFIHIIDNHIQRDNFTLK